MIDQERPFAFRASRGLRTLIAILGAMALLSTGCSGGDDVDEGDQEEGATAETAQPSPEEDGSTESEEPSAEQGGSSEGAEDDEGHEGRLVFADSATDDSLDPAEALGFPRTGPLMLTYDRLIHLSPTIELMPGLATSWEFEDETTLVLQLREGVTFHDGEPFNADAAVANFERNMALEGAGLMQQGVAAIAEATARDEYTLEITTTEPHSGLTFDLTGPAGMMISPAALENDDLDENPVGAGMYTVMDVRIGDRVLYEAYDDYWDPEAVRLAEFELRFIPDADARLTAVRTGDVDFTFIEARQIEVAQQELEVSVSDSIQVWGLFLNLSRPGLDEVAVRQAMSRAIDRQGILEGIFFGEGVATTQMVPPGYYAHSDDHTVENFGYDPEAARALMEEAGYSESNMVQFEALIINRPEDIQLAEVLQAMLAEAYIDMQLRIGDPAQSGLFNVEQETDALLGRWGGRPDPFITYTALFQPGGSFNPGNVTSDEVSTLMDQANSTFDEADRADLAAQVSAAAADQMLGGIPLFSRAIPYALNECVQGFEPYQFGADEFRGVGISSEC